MIKENRYRVSFGVVCAFSAYVTAGSHKEAIEKLKDVYEDALESVNVEGNVAILDNVALDEEKACEIVKPKKGCVFNHDHEAGPEDCEVHD